MKTFARLLLATFSATIALCSPASAQYRPGYPPGPYSGYPGASPTFSPYLNIVGRGNPAINYYGITRPQIEFRDAIYGGGQAVGGPLEEDQFDPALRRGTGHPVLFNNLSHYYYNGPAASPAYRAAGGTTYGRPGSGIGATGSGYGIGVPSAGTRGGYYPSTGSYGIPR